MLGFVPSYKGKLKRKEKEARGPSKKAGTSKKGGNPKAGGHQQKGGSKGREPRVKFPTFRKSAEFWFQGSKAELPGIDVPL